jgi:hypothetical protein
MLFCFNSSFRSSIDFDLNPLQSSSECFVLCIIHRSSSLSLSGHRNDPGFNYEQELPSTSKYTGKQFPGTRTRVIANKTGIERGQEKPGRYTRGTLLRCPESERELDRCIIHKTKHSLDDCRGFRSKVRRVETCRLMLLSSIFLGVRTVIYRQLVLFQMRNRNIQEVSGI